MQDAILKPANFMRVFNILPYGRVSERPIPSGNMLKPVG